MNNNRKPLSLLNYEGDVLTMTKTLDDKYLIKDQWMNPVNILTEVQLYGFLRGEFPLVDSRGKAWNWILESEEAKQDTDKIYHYIQS